MKETLKIILEIIREARQVKPVSNKEESLLQEIAALKERCELHRKNFLAANECSIRYSDAIEKHVPDASMRWAIICAVHGPESRKEKPAANP